MASLNNRRPQTFKEWRQLLNETYRSIGCVLSLRMAKRAGMPHPFGDDEYQAIWNQHRKDAVLTKDLWYLCNQAMRIDRHLMAEIQGGTSGAMRAMMEMLFDDKQNRSVE